MPYYIIEKSESLSVEKAIYKNFRKYNIIDYRDPHEEFDYQEVVKLSAYGRKYFEQAIPAGKISADEITLSIFCAKKPKKMFRAMMMDGQLEAMEESGIYRVKKITDLPFQIVITSELQGSEYAGYRLLADNEEVDEEDIRQIVNEYAMSMDPELQGYYSELIQFAYSKNPITYDRLIKADTEIGDCVQRILKQKE